MDTTILIDDPTSLNVLKEKYPIYEPVLSLTRHLGNRCDSSKKEWMTSIRHLPIPHLFQQLVLLTSMV